MTILLETDEKCIGMWLNGIPREVIAQNLRISEGSISNIVNQCLRNDWTINLQRQIAMVIERSGIDLAQLASNVRFTNAIRRQGANSEAIVDFLSALQKQFDLSEATQEQAIRSIIECSEYCTKQHISLIDLLKHIQDKYNELEKIKSEIIEHNEKLQASTARVNYMLAEDRLTLEAVGDYRRIRNKMRYCGLSLSDSKKTINVMLSLKQMDYDVTQVVELFSKTLSAERNFKSLDEECRRKEEQLATYKQLEINAARNYGNQQRALNDYGMMDQTGLNMNHVFAATAIFSRHIHHFTIDQILYDIDTYGTLKAANIKLSMDLQRMSQQRELL